MVRILVTRRDGRMQQVDAAAGQSLMRGLKSGGIDEVAAICGGCASCGTCHVYIAENWLGNLPPVLADEDAILALSDWREANSRLSCQIRVTPELSGLAVTVAPED